MQQLSKDFNFLDYSQDLLIILSGFFPIGERLIYPALFETLLMRRGGFHFAKHQRKKFFFLKKCTEDSRGSGVLIRSYDKSPSAAEVRSFKERDRGPEEEAPVEECKRGLIGTGATNSETN